jgi:hypothetical protein
MSNRKIVSLIGILGFLSMATGTVRAAPEPAPSGEANARAAHPLPDPGALKVERKKVQDLIRTLGRDSSRSGMDIAFLLLERARLDAGSAASFALYEAAIELAAGSREVFLTFEILAEHAALFPDLDVLERKEAILEKASRGSIPDLAAVAVCQGYLDLAREAALEGEALTAKKALSRAKLVAGWIGDAGLLEAAGDLTLLVQRAGWEHPMIREAERQLSKEGGDPEASHALGLFRCTISGDWEAGLPLLVSGSDPAIAGAAARDQWAPEGLDDRIAVGDAWRDLSLKAGDDVRRGAFKRRAAFWYLRALSAGAEARCDAGTLARVLSWLDINARNAPRAHGRSRLDSILADGCLALGFDPSSIRFASGIPSALDGSGRGNHASIHGARPERGCSGGALRFDGRDDFVEGVGRGVGLPSGGSPVTVILWLRSRQVTGSEACLFHGRETPGCSGTTFRLSLRDGRAELHPPGGSCIGGRKPLADGEWHQVAAVFEGPLGSRARLLVDGEVEAAGPASWGAGGGGTAWRIGAFLEGGGWLQGDVDEVAIFRRALRVDEIRILHVRRAKIAAGLAGLGGITTLVKP